jgi:hypothetical protein
MDPWPTFVRQVDPASGQPVGSDIPIGKSHLVVGVGTGAVAEPVTPYVVVYSNDGTRLVRLDGTGPLTTYRSTAIGDDGRSVIDVQGRVFLSFDRRIVGIDPSGANFLDIARPEPRIPTTLGPGQTIRPGFGRTAALLILPNGDLAAFVDNSVASSLVDLRLGSRLDTSYGYVEGAAVGSDHNVYAVLIDASSANNHLSLAEIDPSNMRLLRTFDLGVSLNNHPLLGMNVIPNSDGSVYVYGSQSPSMSLPASGVIGLFWRFDPSTQTLTSLPVASDLGYLAARGVDGKLYFYAGTAGAAVTTYDTAQSTFEMPTAGTSGPPGSLVRACFVL